MVTRTEDPKDPGSFPYLLGCIVGNAKGAHARAARHIGVSPSYFSVIMNGHQVLNQEAAEIWLEKLRPHYDLSRPFMDTGRTLEKVYKGKIPFLRKPKQQRDLEKSEKPPAVKASKPQPLSKGQEKDVETEFKREAAKLLRAVREANGHTIEELAANLKTSFILRNNFKRLVRLESQDEGVIKTVPGYAYRAAITAVCGFYEQFSPEKSAPYIAQSLSICEQLRLR